MSSFTLRALALWLLLCGSAAATALSDQLTAFFQTRFAHSDTAITVVVRTPAAQWPVCNAPQFSLPGNGRPWGNLSVQARCGDARRFIQVQVQATGQYLAVSRPVRRGDSLGAGDVQTVSGRLDTLPTRLILNPSRALAAVALRDLTPGQPLTESMVRQPWRVKAGQSVQVIAQGDGFSAIAAGKALNNATIAQPVRVRLASGQVVSGRADADGNILITL